MIQVLKSTTTKAVSTMIEQISNTLANRLVRIKLKNRQFKKEIMKRYIRKQDFVIIQLKLLSL